MSQARGISPKRSGSYDAMMKVKPNNNEEERKVSNETLEDEDLDERSLLAFPSQVANLKNIKKFLDDGKYVNS